MVQNLQTHKFFLWLFFLYNFFLHCFLEIKKYKFLELCRYGLKNTFRVLLATSRSTGIPRERGRKTSAKRNWTVGNAWILWLEFKLYNFLHSLVLGRVHSAMVSKLNPQSRSVTVEWYERGETKGKEVELDMLLQLNPELLQDKQNYMPPPAAVAIPTVHQQNTNNLQRVSNRSQLFSNFLLILGIFWWILYLLKWLITFNYQFCPDSDWNTI